MKMLKSRFDSFMKNHLFILSLFRVFQQRKNKKYLEMASLKKNQIIYTRGNETLKFNNNRTFYIIEYDWQTNGFFAIMRKCLDGCAFADSMGWIPFINIENSVFNVPEGYHGIKNMFEYYYKPIENCSLKQIKQNENYIVANSAHTINFYNSFNLMYKVSLSREYDADEELLKYLGGILKKYFILKQEIYSKIITEILEVLPKDKILGVHFRGSDFNTGKKGHPVQCRIEQYFESIDDALDRGFQYIFLATDDKNIVETFLQRYGNRICMFKDVERSSTECGVHFQRHDRKEDQFYLGREVLRDMLTLANCDGLIAGISQVSLFARIQKYSYGKDYIYKHIINNGFNKSDSVKAKKYYAALHRHENNSK